MRHRLPADVLLLVTIVLWSFNFTAVKYGLLHGLLPLVYATIRFGGGSAVFAGYTYAPGREPAHPQRDIALLIGIAGVGIYLNQMCFVYSVDLANASTTALVFGTLPIFVALIAWLARTERLHLRHWVAVASRSPASPSWPAEPEAAVGERRRDPARARRGGHLGRVLGCDRPAHAALLPVPLERDRRPGCDAPARRHGRRPACPAGLVGDNARRLAGASSTACSSRSSSPTCSGSRRSNGSGAARSSLYANLQPFLGAVIAVIALGETMGWLQALGGAVIAAGIVIARQARPPTAQID